MARIVLQIGPRLAPQLEAEDVAKIDFVVEFHQDEEGSGRMAGFHPSLHKAYHPTVEEARAYISTRDPGLTYRIVRETLTREVVE